MHTPGMWQFNLDFAEVQTETEHGTAILAKIQNDTLIDNAEEAEANGYLMAQAPELLAQLCEAVDLFASEVYPGTVGGQWLASARAAIARATREEETQ